MQAFERLTTPVRLVVVGPVFDDLVRYEQRFCPVKEWDRVLSVLRSDNRIELVGPIYGDERFEYLRRAWACVLPSFTEGGSVVVQETLAVGTQMIATRVGPLPEMLEGTPGHRLVDPADADGLRKAIEECLQHPPNEPMGVSQAYLDGGATVFEVLAQQSGASR
jgi:glycosyltransferase involved in cell wall biosynthesis